MLVEPNIRQVEAGASPGEPSVTSCTSNVRDGQLQRALQIAIDFAQGHPEEAARHSAHACETAAGWRSPPLIGTANPIPLLPRGKLIAALMPITSPRALMSGPPLLPKLMAASPVWYSRQARVEKPAQIADRRRPSPVVF